MRNRVYYGEYTLAYWIELILTKKIELPDYQRHFVWSEDNVRTLIETLRDNRFVPPVTIGAFTRNGKKQNLIIDGQQRLTSILLAYLGIFPNKEGYKAHLVALANGDEELPEECEDSFENVLEWNFNSITAKGCSKNEIIGNLEHGNYLVKDFDVTNQFLKTSYLGFSYIVPADNNPTPQQQYYTRVFRDINMKGITLGELESRKSLYFLNDALEQYFAPDFMARYHVALAAGAKQQLDFVRYLSMLAAYEKKGQSVNWVARGYRRYMEQYYEEYIYSVVDGQHEERFGKFEDIFEDRDYQPKMENYRQMLEKMDMPESFPSIINMDVHFFGLIYYTLFCGRELAEDCIDQLKARLQVEADTFRGDPHHASAPGQLKHLRARFSKSIEVYKNYLKP